MTSAYDPDQTIYFGTPGALITLPHPRGGVQATRLRRTSRFDTGGGGVRVSKMVTGRRTYTLSWQALPRDIYALLEAYDQGHQGLGPFVLLDPGRRNMLTANQSAATSVTNDTTDFTIAADADGHSGTIASSKAAYRRGPRSLKWTLPYTNPASPTLLCDPADDVWPGIPVQPVRWLTYSFWVLGGGSDTAVDIAAKLVWLDVDGAVISTSTGTAVTTSSTAWKRAVVSAPALSTAVYVTPKAPIDGTTVSAGAIVYLDQFQLEEGRLPRDWQPGTGIVPLQVTSLAEQWPWLYPDYRTGVTLTLQEVGG